MTTETRNAPGRPGWELVWADEFAGAGALDPEVWRHEHGMVRNQEEQWYGQDLANCRQENGCLLLTATRNPGKRTVKGEAASQAEATCASASVCTRRSFLFGRIEVCARVPKGKGVWPAAWTLGVNIREIGWPRCGEIDIMEYVGKIPDAVHATVHYHHDGAPAGAGPAAPGFPVDARALNGATYFADGHAQCGRQLDTPEPWRDFHVYAVEWDEEKMVFFYDEEVAHSFVYADHGLASDANPFLRPQYLILNLAMGGHWGGEIDEAAFPAVYAIDYVRYYRRAD